MGVPVSYLTFLKGTLRNNFTSQIILHLLLLLLLLLLLRHFSRVRLCATP